MLSLVSWLGKVSKKEKISVVNINILSHLITVIKLKNLNISVGLKENINLVKIQQEDAEKLKIFCHKINWTIFRKC